jgi:hypothetical protein
MRNETGFAALIFFAILGIISTFIFSTVLLSKVNTLTESANKNK